MDYCHRQHDDNESPNTHGDFDDFNLTFLLIRRVMENNLIF